MRKNFSHDPCRARRAFTLLEILVATAIFSVLLGALYGVMRGGFQLRESAFETVESGLPKDYVAGLIRRDFSSIVPPVGILAGAMIGEKNDQKGGRADRLEFFTASGVVQNHEPWGDVQQVAYYLLEADEEIAGRAAQDRGYDLVRAVKRNLLTPIEQDPQEQRLLSGVESLTFEYYDGETRAWQETWDSTTLENQTPAAVRMSLVFMPLENRNVPTMPIELVCEIVAKARQAETPATTATGGSGTENEGGSGPGGASNSGGGR